MSNQQASLAGIQSTAGAVPVRNEKGEISMQKVKVQRYISGKRPEYAQYQSTDDESDQEDFIDHRKSQKHAIRIEERRQREAETQSRHEGGTSGEIDDARLRRLTRRMNEPMADRLERHRHIHEPEILERDEDEDMDEAAADDNDNESMLDGDVRPVRFDIVESPPRHVDRSRRIQLGSDNETDSDLSDTELERRRDRRRQKTLQQRKREEAEIMQVEEEKQSEPSDSESSEYEEETESEEENEPRLKPLFVRKRDRTTVIEKEKEDLKQKQVEHEAKKAAKERRRQTLRLVEESVKKDLERNKPETAEPNIEDVCTEDENDEVEYEEWKLRELKRIKRDREEKETVERERVELDRVRNMTEDERRQEMRLNPKTVTNKAAKGKYKFLQKYYHRGAFYLDEEQDVFKRDFAQATLEDHFDKTILPKVMQVKNFGRCGRTKYTHLVDQDTTQFDSPWYSETVHNVKFHNEKAGGMKQAFDKPTLVNRKRMM